MPYDDTEFVDRDFPSSHAPSSGGAGVKPGAGSGRAPSREELDAQVTMTQQQLAELRQKHEQLERERADLEEKRRRRADFQAGRAEALDALTRGVGLLEKAQFEAQRNAVQMAATLESMRASLTEVQGLSEEEWTESNWMQEMSRAMTAVENARMELASARMKWPVLDGNVEGERAEASRPGIEGLAGLPTKALLRIGFALTWPLLALGLVAVAVFAVAAFRR